MRYSNGGDPEAYDGVVDKLSDERRLGVVRQQSAKFSLTVVGQAAEVAEPKIIDEDTDAVALKEHAIDQHRHKFRREYARIERDMQFGRMVGIICELADNHPDLMARYAIDLPRITSLRKPIERGAEWAVTETLFRNWCAAHPRAETYYREGA